jgi:hypothetical protein
MRTVIGSVFECWSFIFGNDNRNGNSRLPIAGREVTDVT